VMFISSTLVPAIFGETRALDNNILAAYFLISYGWQAQGYHGQC